MPGITNPISIGATNSFVITTYNSDGKIIDKVSTGVTVTMTSTAFMKSVTLTPSSYVNSAIAVYTF